MNELLLSIGSFLVTLGLLVTVHEFGHFWVARRLGVKVLRFSVGFGTPLWSRRSGPDQTEYAIGALPLGGYVTMLDETEAPVDPSESHRAFNRQGVSQRMAIVVAGPLANLLFAVVAYWLMFVVGITGLRPLLGAITPGTPAAVAGFTAGEEILSVAGRPTPTWEAVTIALIQGSLTTQEGIRLETVDSSNKRYFRILNLEQSMFNEPGTALRNLGLRPGYPSLPPLIDRVEPNGPAFKAGFAPGDRIRRINEQPIEYWEQWLEYIRAHPGVDIQVEVERSGGNRILTVAPDPSGPRGTVGHIGVSVRVPDGYGERLRTELRYSPGDALGAALTKVWEMSILTLQLLGKMVIGEASIENISGPITIAQLAGKSIIIGFTSFLSFLGLISLSLGVINLLPIPILDGGHLLYYFIELITGAPLPEWVATWGQKLGTAILLGLMSLALFNDFNRILGF
ncbi:intramembrane zinc metalloprotease RseP [Gammaproteobacteria bacterium]